MAFSSQRLREAREALTEHGRKVSQERFADMVGVSRRSPGRWENPNDPTEPRLIHLQKIASITGRPIGFFFDEEPGEVRLPQSDDMMAALLEQLGESLLEHAREMRGSR